MKALVTGGGGFLGRAIIEALVKEGHTVRSFSRGDYPELKNQGVECIRGDIEKEKDIRAACRQMDIVFHTAAKVGVFGKLRDFYNTNCVGTKNVIEACKVQGVSRLIFTSSSSVTYSGTDKINADESDPYPKKFLTPYSHTKALAEKMVLDVPTGQLSTIALRPHLIFGPRDKYIIPGIIKRAPHLRIIGDGKNMTDVTYIDNIAMAHLLAAKNTSISQQVYYITQGKPLNLWDWVNRILKELNFPPIERHMPVGLAYLLGTACEGIYKIFAPNRQPPMTRVIVRQLSTTHTYSILKAKKDLGYEPKISTEVGLERTLDYFRQKLDQRSKF